MSPDQLAVLTDQICPRATPIELELFLTVCQRTGLDPFSRQIYGIKRKQWDQEAGAKVEKLSIQISVDGYRTIAARTGLYEGQTMPEFCGPDGQWREIWIGNQPPVASRVGVWRKGFRTPIYGVAYWHEYAQTKADGSPTTMWAKMPATMLAKCAETQALRKAFPNETAAASDSREEALATAPTASPSGAVLLEDGTYRGAPAHKRALQAAVRRAGEVDPRWKAFDTPSALRELSGAVLGCPLEELDARVLEVLSEGDDEEDDPAIDVEA